MVIEIDYESQEMFFQIEYLKDDQEMIKLIQSCIKEQKRIGQQNFKEYFRPNDQSKYYVSKEALDRILETREDISDIRTHTDITNCIVFHTKNLDGSLLDDSILERRRQADEVVIDRIKKLFGGGENLFIEVSGHFWYPSGGFMGWHTNLRKPGWRMYVNYCEDEGKSFFRYRDPDSKEIMTCSDKIWNFRLFKIVPEKPFWHCVYSDTNRFSLGYKIELDEK